MKLNISQQEYEQLRNSGLSKDAIVSKYSEKPFSIGSAVNKFGNAVTDFTGMRGLSDQFSSSVARLGLRATGNNQAAQLVPNPSVKQLAGSLVQTGANAVPAIKGTKLLPKVLGGAFNGYLYDVGSNLQLNKPDNQALKPGIGTIAGGTLPILGKIVGLASNNLPAAAAKKLEETNLRLTPVERQNLQKKGQDIATFLAKKKVIGTPQQRLGTVNKLYNQMEGTIQNTIKKSGITYDTARTVEGLNQLPDQFINDPELANEVNSVVKKLSINLQKRGATIPAEDLNILKRNYMNRAFGKNATDVVSDSRLAVGAFLNQQLRDRIPKLQPLNKEYGYIIASKRALQKATSRPQIGLVGKIAGITAGTTLGNMVGGPAGAAAGAVIGPTIGKTVAGTFPRSIAGASLQTISEISSKIQSLPTDPLGNISQKAVQNLLQEIKRNLSQNQ